MKQKINFALLSFTAGSGEHNGHTIMKIKGDVGLGSNGYSLITFEQANAKIPHEHIHVISEDVTIINLTDGPDEIEDINLKIMKEYVKSHYELLYFIVSTRAQIDACRKLRAGIIVTAKREDLEKKSFFRALMGHVLIEINKKTSINQ